MKSEEMKLRSKGISSDMSPEAIMERLTIVRDLYEAPKQLSDFNKITGPYARQLPELRERIAAIEKRTTNEHK